MAFSFSKILTSLGGTKKPVGSSTVVGIDIGSASVKVVEIVDENNQLRLATYGELQLGPYGKAPLGFSVDLTVEERTEAIVDVLRESNSKADTAILTVQLAQSFVTSIALNAKEEEIAARVPVEARKVIPVPLSDVALEWVEVPPLPNTPENVHEILVAAIQKSSMDETKQIIASLQKKSSTPEIEVFSAVRALSGEEEVLVIIDCGAKNNKLYIVQEGYLRRLHRVQAGGSLATQRVADLLSLEFAEAENIKRNFDAGSEQGADIKKAVLSTYERSMQEFKRALSQYELRSGAKISRVVVTGGAATFPEFAAFVAYALDRPVELADPFSKISYPAFMEDTIKEIGPTFSVALGAALRNFE